MTSDVIETRLVTIDDRELTLEEAQEFVGGLIEVLRLPDGSLMVIDEEGKLKGKPVNLKATQIAHEARAIFPGDVIVGDALILKGDAVTGGWSS